MHRASFLLTLVSLLALAACSTGGTVQTVARVNRTIVTDVDIYRVAKVSVPVVDSTRETTIYKNAWDLFYSRYLFGIEEIALTPNGLPDLTTDSVVKEGVCATLKYRISEGEFPAGDDLELFLTGEFERRAQPQLSIRSHELATGILNLVRDLESAHSPSDVGFAISTAAVCLSR